MTFLDYFVIIILVMSIASSAANGLVRSSLTLLATIIGFVLAGHFYSYGALIANIVLDDPRICNFLGFASIFVLAVIAGTAASHMMRQKLQQSGLTWADKMLGAGFGCIRGWLITSAIYLALLAFPIQFEAVQRAAFAPFLTYGSQAITYAATDEVRDQFFRSYSKLQQGWNKRERSSR